MHPNWKSIAGKLSLAVGSLLFCFFLAETASRIRLYLHTPKGLVFDEALIFRCEPFSDIWACPLNDNGDIGPNVRQPKRDGEKRIFLLGGSTSHSTSYVAAVQTALDAADPKGDYAVVSSGKPRYTSYNNLQNAKLYLHQFDPDVFLVFLGVNDCIYNSFPHTGSLPDVGYWDYSSLKESIFFALLKYYVIEKKFLLTPDWAGKSIRSPGMLEAHLRELIEFSQAKGIRVAMSTFLLSYPTQDPKLLAKIESDEEQMKHFWGTIDSTVYGVAQHNEVIRRLAAEFSLPLTELDTSHIPATSEYFNDICHMTDKGRTIRGQMIGNTIASMFSKDTPKN